MRSRPRGFYAGSGTLRMTKKIIFAIGAVAATVLSIAFVPGFAHEIAAAVTPASKLQSVESNINPGDPACAHAPWPFGCDWGAAAGRKKIVKKSRAGHGHHAHTAMRQGQVLLGRKL
jgi:hypothetical protein